MPISRTFTRVALTGGALALSVALSACGGGATAPSTSPTPSAAGAAGASTERNDADIRFAQSMIPHHNQAVEMAELARDRAENPDVVALAEQIRSAQAPEIETLTGYLTTWGAEVPAQDGMAGMDHSGMPGMSEMSGMTTPEQMDQMRNATGAAFDTLFLENMIVHHEGAITDAQRELAEGVSPQAKDLANQIISAQSEEITRMRQLLGT